MITAGFRGGNAAAQLKRMNTHDGSLPPTQVSAAETPRLN
jgi:hypothetical protein